MLTWRHTIQNLNIAQLNNRKQESRSLNRFTKYEPKIIDAVLSRKGNKKRNAWSDSKTGLGESGHGKMCEGYMQMNT